MQPVLRRDAADAEVSAAQNLLADRCDHNGVIYIVVGRITAGNVFEREPCHKTDDAGIARLQQPIGSLIGELEFANKCFDDDLRRLNILVTFAASLWQFCREGSQKTRIS